MRLKFRIGGLDFSRIPSPLVSNVEGTWAYDTMTRRVLEDVFSRIMKDNEEELRNPTHPARINAHNRIMKLKEELSEASRSQLRLIEQDGGPDVDFWNDLLASIPPRCRNWLDAPWVIVEFYVYRRIIESFGFFTSPYDMFSKQKLAGLVDCLPAVDEVAKGVFSMDIHRERREYVEAAVLTSLWGNKMDLSIWPAAHHNQSNDTHPASNQQCGQIVYGDKLHSLRSYILDDHLDEVVTYILSSIHESSSPRRVDVIVDNAGYELVSDLLLAHCLIAAQITDQVVFHTKGHPTFVSDVTDEDIALTIDHLLRCGRSGCAQLGQTFAQYFITGQFSTCPDLFHCQPTAFWDMPEHMESRLACSRLVFVKGDANYRRLLGDRNWPLDTPAKDILSYWPVPVCALRTMKAELGCGLTVEAQQRALREDPKYLVSGRWGVVQYYNPDN